MCSIKTINVLWILILSIGFTTAATAFWVDGAGQCPATNASEFPGQDCSPNDICGDSSGIAQCYDTSTLTAPTSGLSVTDQTTAFNGGWLINCFATADAASPFCDNNGAFWCDRNSSIYNSPILRQTNCTDFGETEMGICRSGRYDCFGNVNECEATSTSNCNASTIPNTRYDTDTCEVDFSRTVDGTCECDPGFFTCDGSIVDADGCEITDAASCGFATGNIVADQCWDASNGNCTNYASGNLDCNNDDADNVEATCNGGVDGCEIDPGTTANNTNNHWDSCTEFSCDGSFPTQWLDCDGNGFGNTTGNGCEVQNGSSCTVGPVSGTVVGCSGGAPICSVDDQDIAQTGQIVNWSGTNPMLWLRQFGAGLNFNFTDRNNVSFIMNFTGLFYNNTNLLASAGNPFDQDLNTFDNVTFSNLNVTNEVNASKYSMKGGSYIKVNDSEDWIDSELAIVIGNNADNLGTGVITSLHYAQENRTLWWTQFGKNNSYGGWGNSFGLVPNNLGEEQFIDGGKVNMTALSNYLEVCDYYNISCTFKADTSGRGGPLLFTTGDLEVFRVIRGHEGVFVNGDSSFIMEGNDFDIINGSMHLRNQRIEEQGVVAGQEVQTFRGDFDNGILSPFEVTIAIGVNSWAVVSEAQCHSDLCATAGSSVITNMQANFSTNNLNHTNVSFWMTEQNLDATDDFNVTFNNNEGSGEIVVVDVLDIIGATDTQYTFSLPESMQNRSTITMNVYLNVDHPVNEIVWVDEFILIGNAIETTLANVTVFDTQILGGTGDGEIQILYNATSEQWVFSPNNVSFGNILEIDLNVTGSITLDGETITNWDNVSLYDDNVLLRNGSRGLTGQWNQGDWNLTSTTSWFLGIVNWSSILNSPVFALASDVVSWISGNRTDSEANMLSNISDVNTTANIESLNFTQGPHTIDTNCSGTGDCSNITYLDFGNDGLLNITNSNNISIDNETFVCLNQACSRWIMSNGSGTFIQG